MVNLTDEQKKEVIEFLADRKAMTRVMKKILLVCGVIISIAGAWAIFKG